MGPPLPPGAAEPVPVNHDFSFFDASPDCIRILDLDGRIEAINAGGLALLGIDDFTQVHGRRWPSLWPEASRAIMEEALTAAAAGQTRAFRALSPNAKGLPRWWDTAVWPVFGPDRKTPVRLVARSHDITGEMADRAFLEAIVELVPAGLFAKDSESGRFLLFNHAAEEIFGFSRETMVGKTVHDIFPKAQAKAFDATDLQVIAAGGQVVVEEEQVTTGDGAVRWFRTKKVAVNGVQGVWRLIGLSEDITEAKAAGEILQRAYEQAEAANQAKSAFLATMGHEIRTPLNGLLGMTQAMQRGALDDAQRDRLRVIRRSGETLLAILNDLLDISKIEAGALEFEIADFDMEHLTRGAVAAFAAEAAKKDVTFDFVVEDAARSRFTGDGARVRRLLYGLLSNAVKFTPTGRVGLTVSYGDGVLGLEVLDTGIGIPAPQIPRLFDKFVQGDDGDTRRFGGSGLGLSICRGLVDLMGGSIGVASAPGEGSVFSVRLPLTRATEPGPTAASEAPLAAPKVLAAEDNAVNQLVLRTLLQQGGIDPVIVENGVEALAAWERENWDVVLMDIQMPVMDGVSATRAIRSREAATGRARTPILAVTANAMAHQLETYHAAGIDGVVPKPLVIDQLFAALHHALEPEAAVAEPVPGLAER